MWLISGGAYQGKLKYALERTGINESEATEGKDCSLQELLEKPLVNHFHLWIDRMLKEEQDINILLVRILARNPEIVIIVDELGCGVVPMNPYDRRYREMTGRICCKLAKEAEEVHRVICGIGTVIKHA
jgi:adenosyl cobinamide kinase/adenosyl cobinamide phosphate guanylyltransferase